MAAWLDMLAAAARPPVWLDDTAYSARLLAGGAAPWLNVGACVAWRRKALQLLRPSVAVLDVEACVSAWIGAHADLQQRLRASHQPVAPLRAALAEDALRTHLTELVQALRVGTDMPLALLCPTPRRWLAQLFARAFGESVDPDEDGMDDASTYIANFLRVFAAGGVDALLLRDEVSLAPLTTAEWDCCGSLVNLARHYRWDLGLRVAGTAPADALGVDFLIASQGGAGVALPSNVWQGAALPSLPRGTFAYAAIPADADPARVLEQLDRLR